MGREEKLAPKGTVRLLPTKHLFGNILSCIFPADSLLIVQTYFGKVGTIINY